MNDQISEDYDYAQQLIDAKALIGRIEGLMRSGPCRLYGCDMHSVGGKNAGCSDHCSCSVQVNVCRKCGDCDYGDNEDANRARRDCNQS